MNHSYEPNLPDRRHRGRGRRGHRMDFPQRSEGRHPHGGHRSDRGPGRRARRGEVRLAVLLLINEQPMNGYQIIQTLAERTDGAWSPSSGAVYPALALLEDEGLIRSTDADGRKAFAITDAGREQAKAYGDAPLPWEPSEQSDPMHSPRAMHAELRQLELAARAVMSARKPELAQPALTILENARKDLYRLLSQ